MTQETKTCQNCTQAFSIEPGDLDFYEKTSVPPPTWCPECRVRRRMSFRNERTLYRRKCDVTGEDIISVFAPDSEFKVCKKEHWYSDEFDPMQYGRDIDFTKSFFQQFYEFSKEIPLPSLRLERSENCEYNNDMSDCKNCYMCARTHAGCEEMYYVYRGNASSQCMDSMQVVKGSDRLYESVECVNCHNSTHLYFCNSCSDSSFLYDCRNCIDCFMCTNLRNKQYCFKNQELGKEAYKKKIEEYDLSSYATLKKLYDEFEEFKQDKALRRNVTSINSPGSRGDNLIDCRNCYMCFGVKFSENGRYLWDVMFNKDSADAYSGGKKSELTYETTSVTRSSRCKFSMRVTESTDVEYSYFCRSSKNLFGCIGLDHKEYCILNTQYSESEYDALVTKLKDHMNAMPYTDKAGNTYAYGEFFPPETSPFGYNETVAYDWFPLEKQEATERGFNWRTLEEKSYDTTKEPDELSDRIDDVDDTILEEVIGCIHKGTCNHQCTTAFKVIPQELTFYRKMKLPLPRLCPNCRHHRRLAQRQPMKLWDGKCQCAGARSENGNIQNTVEHFHGNDHCPNVFETSYAPDRPETVYCERCYQSEIM